MRHGAFLGVIRAVAAVLGVVTLTFVLLHLAPGDPVVRLLGPDATAAQRAAARHALGLDRPLLAQYGSWLSRTVHGDFGSSFVTGRPVSAMLGEAWPATALLVAVSLAASYLFGVIIGTLQANTRRRGVDGAVSAASVTLNAVPGYWLGLVLVMLFTYRLRWLPAFGAAGLDAGFLGPGARLLDRLRHLALPWMTLTLIGMGGVARFARASMRELREAPFLMTARARGLSPRQVVWRHQLRNGLVPLVTLLGLSLPAFFSGTVFVEAIFAWPGVGHLLVSAVGARDYPVVMAAVTVSAVLVVAGNLLAEGAVLLLDPRSRVGAAVD